MIFSFGIDKGGDKVYILCIQRILNVPQEKRHAVRTSQNSVTLSPCRDALLGLLSEAGVLLIIAHVLAQLVGG